MIRLTILVTGSRHLTDRTIVRSALLEEYQHAGVEPCEVLVRHGAQGFRGERLVQGTDMIADGVARELGMSVDPHPADWHTPCRDTCRPGHRRIGKGERDYCLAAGLWRNASMVALGADVCLAFPLGQSPGTRDCMRRAKAARTSVRNVTELAAVTP